MTRFFRREDADPSRLAGRTIAVVGYGNQGRAQALNLRDAGRRILIGNRDDCYAESALADGFEVLGVADAVADADVTMLLLPDEVLPSVFDASIRPALKASSTIVFASGYCIAYQTLVPPKDVDVVLLAPRMIGAGVRELGAGGEGFYSFVAVHQDVTGQALSTLLALADGIGSLVKGALEVDFKTEAELDLFNEQAFGPAFGKVLLTSMQTLLDAGYPKEAVFLELFLSGELSYICRDMADTGLISQLDHHSPTSQYGAMSRGIQFLGVNLARPMKRILKSIRSGAFAREWSFEQRTGRLRYRFLHAMARRLPMGKVEQAVRKTLGLP